MASEGGNHTDAWLGPAVEAFRDKIRSDWHLGPTQNGGGEKREGGAAINAASKDGNGNERTCVGESKEIGPNLGGGGRRKKRALQRIEKTGFR